MGLKAEVYMQMPFVMNLGINNINMVLYLILPKLYVYVTMRRCK